MSKSERIRELHANGDSIAQIAKKVGVRYQFAYNVINRGNPKATSTKVSARPAIRPPKPALTADALLAGGFVQASRWVRAENGRLSLEKPLLRDKGVYAFVKAGVALYVGIAASGFANRCGFYMRPGKTQRTSIRVNAKLLSELAAVDCIDIYTATPSNSEWNGWPVDGAAGLEVGLIEKYHLPWNIRGAGPRTTLDTR